MTQSNGHSHWRIDGDVLTVYAVDGSKTVPTADEIFTVIVEHGDCDSIPAPSNELEGIHFSKYPALLEVRVLAGKASNGSEVGWEVVAVTEDAEGVVEDILSRDADHIIIGTTWHPLIKDNMVEIQGLLQSAGVVNRERLSLRQYLSLKAASATASLVKDLTSPSDFREQITLQPATLPVTFQGVLYPYQEEGFKWLRRISDEGIGAILADEMGLGKTIQVIALFISDKHEQNLSSLVVTTGTLLENWRREIARFAPVLTTMVHQGASRTGFPSELRASDVVITSYDTLARDLSMFRQVKWNIVVLDEAQAIKNPDTRRARTVKRLPRRVSIAVTGTPVENYLTDLWSIMDFVLPGYLGDLPSFLKKFSNDHAGALALEPFISPLILRRRVAEVAGDLPPRIDIPQALVLDDESAREYEKLRASIEEEYGDKATLVALGKLRMFCTHPFLVSGQCGDLLEASPKYRRLAEILEEIFYNNEKTIIFTSYTAMTDLLLYDIRTRFGVFVDFIDGRVPVSDRQAVVDRFSEINGSASIILNPRAAGTGLNITAANHVIHYNLEWNPALEDQASARAYRRGQTLPVTVHRLYYADTVEDVINDRLFRKRDLATLAVVGHEGGTDDLKDFFSAIRISPLSRGLKSGKS